MHLPVPISPAPPLKQSGADWNTAFQQPPATYRPVLFWSWNELLQSDEVYRQLEQMRQGGCGGAFMHSRKGLITPYLGEPWFEAVAAVVKGCQQRDLKVWLYDEDTWPSGFSGGTVPLANPSFRPTVIFAAPQGAAVPLDATPLSTTGDNALQLYRFTEPLGNPRFNGTSYINPLHRPAVRTFLEQAYEPYHQRFAAHYGKLIPATFTDEPAPLSLANFQPEGSVPFSPELPEHFQKLHGYDPMPMLHLLFTDAPAAARFRLHYYRTVNDLFVQNFTRQIADWCARRGIAFTGHFMSEDKVARQQAVGAAPLFQYRYMDLPGIDHLGRQVGERVTAKVCQSMVNQFAKPRMLSELYGAAGQNISFADRMWIAKQQIALGVNLLVPHLALYTMAGCRKRDYPGNLFYQQPWWPMNHVLETALSRLCVAMSQGRCFANVLVIHPVESAFVHWKARPHEAGEKLTRLIHQQPVGREVTEVVQAIDERLQSIVDMLLAERIGFDFGEEGVLAELATMQIRQGRPRLCVGAMVYDAIVLPSMRTMRRTTLQLLQRFTEHGGAVFCAGEAPTLLDGEPSADLDHWIASLDRPGSDRLVDRLRSAAPQAVQFAPADDAPNDAAAMTWSHVRELGDGDRLVFLVNLDRHRAVEGTLRIAGQWRSAAWLDVRDGGQVSADVELTPDAASCRIRLEPVEHLLLRLSSNASDTLPVGRSTSAALMLIERERQEVPVDFGQSRLERLDDNALTLDSAYWKEGEGAWSDQALPVIVIQQRLDALKYEGPLTLRYVVRNRDLKPGRKLHLVVEYPERYRILLNGQEVRYAGLPYWRDIRWLPIDITGLLTSSENVIELHCAAFRHGDATRYDEPARRYGTEVESIYLVGDFSVEGRSVEGVPAAGPWEQRGLPRQPLRWLDSASLALAEPGWLKAGDVTAQGLPFYAGRLRWSCRLEAAVPAGEQYHLRVDSIEAAAGEVAIDGEPIGPLLSTPGVLHVPASLWQQGAELQVTLYGTLRNLLGPHHHPDGEMPMVTPQDFAPWAGYPNYPDDPAFPENVLAWACGEITPPRWRDAYCVTAFGHIGEMKLYRFD